MQQHSSMAIRATAQLTYLFTLGHRRTGQQQIPSVTWGSSTLPWPLEQQWSSHTCPPWDIEIQVNKKSPQWHEAAALFHGHQRNSAAHTPVHLVGHENTGQQQVLSATWPWSIALWPSMWQYRWHTCSPEGTRDTCKQQILSVTWCNIARLWQSVGQCSSHTCSPRWTWKCR